MHASARVLTSHLMLKVAEKTLLQAAVGQLLRWKRSHVWESLNKAVAKESFGSRVRPVGGRYNGSGSV